MRDDAAWPRETGSARRSRPVTSCPAAVSAWHSARPINPVGPVTRHFKPRSPPCAKKPASLVPEAKTPARSRHDTDARSLFQTYHERAIACQRRFTDAADFQQLLHRFKRSEHFPVADNRLGSRRPDPRQKRGQHLGVRGIDIYGLRRGLRLGNWLLLGAACGAARPIASVAASNRPPRIFRCVGTPDRRGKIPRDVAIGE